MTTVITRPTPPPRPGRGRSVGRAAVHGLGELMITAGLVMLLLVVYMITCSLQVNEQENT